MLRVWKICETPKTQEQSGARRSANAKSAMKYEISCWLALRASVLRRAVSSSGAAQERRAAFAASLFSEAIEAHTQDSCQPFAFAIAPQSQRGVANKMQHRLLYNPYSLSQRASPNSRQAIANVSHHSRQAVMANPTTRTSPLVKSVFKKFGISS